MQGSLEAAEQNAHSGGKFAQAAAETIAMILEALADYLEKESEFAPQKSLAAWIRGKGEVCAYPVQGDCIGELKYELDKLRIPYIDLANTNRILIKAPDLDEVKELNRSILIAKTNYFQDVDGRELENAIASSDRIPDKEIFTLHNLNKYQVEVLKNKCNSISSGFMVGITETSSGTFDVSIRASNLFSENAKMDFCKAFMQMTISLYGPNNSIKIDQIDADEQIDIAVELLKGKDEVHYIVGVDDPSKYIEINGHDFQYYSINTANGERVERLITQCSADDPNYASELQRCMDKIYNKAILNNAEDLGKHLSTKKRNIESSRPRKNKREYQNSIAGKRLGETLDILIKKRIREENMTFAGLVDKFIFYQDQAAELLEHCIKGTPAIGYAPKDIKQLTDIFDECHVEVKNYSHSASALRNHDCDAHLAKKMEKVKSAEVRKEYETRASR